MVADWGHLPIGGRRLEQSSDRSIVVNWGRPKMRWVDNVRQDASSLEVRDWQASARDRGQWKAVLEAAVGLQTL